LPFTLISDVTTGYLGDVPPDEYLTSKIDEVELILARRLGDLQVWADSDLRARALRVVVARAVRRGHRDAGGCSGGVAAGVG
jgi:sporulation-control protein spo0M